MTGLPVDASGAAEILAAPEIEISPLLSYAGEGLAKRVGGKSFKSPAHLSEKVD